MAAERVGEASREVLGGGERREEGIEVGGCSRVVVGSLTSTALQIGAAAMMVEQDCDCYLRAWMQMQM